MATGFTAGTSLGSQYQYTPITFAPLVSLVPQRQEAPAAPAPTGLEATAQMPVPQYMGEAQGPGGEMQPFSGPMVGEQPFGQVMSDIGNGLSMVMNPLSNLVSLTMFGKTVPELMTGMFGQQQQQTQQQAPVVTLEMLTLANQIGVPVQDLIDAGFGPGSMSPSGMGPGAAEMGFSMPSDVGTGADIAASGIAEGDSVSGVPTGGTGVGVM